MTRTFGPTSARPGLREPRPMESETHIDIRSTLRGKVQSLALVLEASVSANLSNSPRLFWDT